MGWLGISILIISALIGTIAVCLTGYKEDAYWGTIIGFLFGLIVILLLIMGLECFIPEETKYIETIETCPLMATYNSNTEKPIYLVIQEEEGFEAYNYIAETATGISNEKVNPAQCIVYIKYTNESPTVEHQHINTSWGIYNALFGSYIEDVYTFNIPENSIVDFTRNY